jgi:hypothetical protein
MMDLLERDAPRAIIVSAILAKMQVHSRLEAAALARQKNML